MVFEMTNRFHSLTVVLEKDIREDDAEALMAAISQLRGVLNVTGEVSTPETYMAVERARHEIKLKLYSALKDL